MRRILLPAIVAIVCATSSAFAVTLDWSAQTWAPGSLSNSFDVDPTTAGNDVTVTAVANGQNRFTTDPASGLMSPAITQSLAGGNSPAPSSLEFVTNWNQQTQSVTITVTLSAAFAAKTDGATFTLFNIDRQGVIYQDQIQSVYGVALDGVTLVAPTFTNVGPAITLTGTGLNQVLQGQNTVADTGAGSGAGNATLTFSVPIQSFTFTYIDGLPTKNNPTVQDISLANITFSPVPEMSSWLAGAVACAAAAVIRLRKRAA
jgi:hypothetical protein